MGITKKILELLAQEPKLNANEIVAKTGGSGTCVKATLYYLTKKNRVLREKVLKTEAVRVGPKNVYIYSLPEVVPV
jgi:DeoR/GlpR family transcriptional regulator of sugar metabolism